MRGALMLCAYDADVFLKRLSEADERERMRLWGTLVLFPYRHPVTVPLIDAAIEAIKLWGLSLEQNLDNRLGHALSGIRLLFRAAIRESIPRERQIAERLLDLCASVNVRVASYSIYFFGERPWLRELCVPTLKAIALEDSLDEPVNALPLKDIAYYVLADIAPDTAKGPDLAWCRERCIRSLFRQAQSISDDVHQRSLYDHYCDVANQLTWL